MADVFDGPFGTYVDVAGIIVAASQTQVGTALIECARMFGVTLVATEGAAGTWSLVTSVDSPHPDFDAIRPEIREHIGRELAAVWDAVDAAPIV